MLYLYYKEVRKMRVMSIDASTKSTGIAIFFDGKLETYKCLTESSKDVY